MAPKFAAESSPIADDDWSAYW